MSIQIPEVTDPKVAHALDIIKNRYLEIRTVKEVAEQIGISDNTLGKRFEIRGLKPPRFYLNGLRKDYAEKHVKENIKTLSTIAKEMGFGKTNQLHTWYLAAFGVRATEVRRGIGIPKDAHNGNKPLSVIAGEIKAKIDQEAHHIQFERELYQPYGYGRNAIYLAFSQAYGCTVREHLINTQLAYVERKIREQGYCIPSLLKHTIYNNASALSNAFERKYGMCSSDYAIKHSIGVRTFIFGESRWVTSSFVKELLEHIAEDLLTARQEMEALRNFYQIGTKSWREIFISCTGMSPKQTQLGIEMEMILHIVQTTDWTIQDIYERLNRSRRDSWCARFRDYFNCAPAQAKANPKLVIRNYDTKQFKPLVEEVFNLIDKNDGVEDLAA